MTNFFAKGHKEHKPSLKIEDIRLSSGWYLIKKMIFKQDMVESEAGIWLPIDGSEQPPNISKVIKCADKGCTLAIEGDYVMNSCPGGNEHDDKKPYPLVRVLGDLDENNYWVIHNDYIPLVIPPEKIQTKISPEELN